MTSEFQFQSFSDHLGSVLRELFLDQSNSDVTLVCDDLKQFQLHKFILRASSQTLRTLLDSHPHPNPLIYLRGVSSEQLEAILEFIYLGETTFQHDKVTDFLKVASDLELKAILNGLVSPEIGTEKSTNEEVADKMVEDDNKANIFSLQQTTEKNEDSHTESPAAADEEHSEAHISVQESMKIPEPEESESMIKDKMEEKTEDTSKIKEEEEEEHSLKIGKKRKRSQVILRKNPDEEDLFLCDRCDFKGKRVPFLNHYQYEHEGVKYQCSQCGLEYKTNKYLQTHVKSVHEGVKYPCTKCDYQATQECNLKVHMESMHEGIRHPCQYCPYKATQRRHLKTHVKRVHTTKTI